MRFKKIPFLLWCWMFGLLCGCDTRRESTSALPSYEVMTRTVSGVKQQVIKAQNGISLYFSDTNIVVWIGDRSDIVLAFDSETLAPQSLLFEIPEKNGEPAQSVWDYNADGIPDVRQIAGSSTNDLLFQGEWYPKHFSGTNLIIFVNGRGIVVRWDGRRYVEKSAWKTE